jgi:uncharacterized repeat protein (TIGR03847 family)
MPNTEIELNPVDFITVGTVGPKGRRQFNLQGGQNSQIITLTLEKEQARRLAEAIRDMLEELENQGHGSEEPIFNIKKWDMTLRDPIEPQFRVSQMGLGFDELQDKIILVAQELVISEDDGEILDDIDDIDGIKPSVVRFWGTKEQYRVLSEHTFSIIDQGRADPKQNGHVIYYWT